LTRVRFSKLLFGTAGIPVSTENRSSIEGIKRVKELGLDCMEMEFVRGVHMTEPTARAVGVAAKNKKIALTAHAPFFINLNAIEPQKIGASRSRILKTAHIANICGASSITFHAGFYLKQEPDQVYNAIKVQLKKVVDQLKEDDNKVWIRPELTGKPTQFGDLKELIKLSQDLDQVLPCIDFAHYFARYAGKKNSYEYYAALLEQIEKELGREALDNMHIHMSGIHYGDKGERNHLILEESDINYKAIVKAWKDFKIKGIVICESPNIEDDALLLKSTHG